MNLKGSGLKFVSSKAEGRRQKAEVKRESLETTEYIPEVAGKSPGMDF